MTDPILLSVDRLSKHFKSGDKSLTVLDDVTFAIPRGSTCAIMGPSGAGKTTLLGICAGLDLPDTGAVTVDGVEVSGLSEEERAAFRRESLGFVFQAFRLVPTLSALENVMIPLELLGRADARAQARALLERVGLGQRIHHLPAQMSGGEQQRVAIARAFIHRPKILFADEPTGNLDAETGETIAGLLFELNRVEKTTLVIVTHNAELAARTNRILRLAGGRLVSA